MNNKRKRTWSAFIQGIKTTSIASLLGTLSVSLTVSIACFVTFTPEKMASDFHRYFFDGPLDFGVTCTSRVLRTALRKKTKNEITVVGASSLREAIVSNRYLQTQIEGNWKGNIEINSIFCPGLTFWELEEIVEQLSPKLRGILILDIGIRRFSVTRKNNIHNATRRVRLGFISKAKYDKDRGLSRPILLGNFLWDNRNYYFARLKPLLRNLIFGPVPPLRHYYLSTDGSNLQTITPVERSDVPPIDFGFNFKTIQRIVHSLKSNPKLTTVFLESPHPEMQTGFFHKYQSFIKAYAQTQHIEYWDVSQVARLMDHEFVDGVHLGSLLSAKRFTNKLARSISKLLSSGKMGVHQQNTI